MGYEVELLLRTAERAATLFEIEAFERRKPPGKFRARDPLMAMVVPFF